MPDKFKPRTKEIARRLWGIYILLTVVNVGLLMLSGVNFFDSLCQAFATIATGGFSTKNASLGYFPAAAQYITMIFMILSGINFTLHYFALKGKFNIIRKNSELKAYLLIILTAGFILTFYLFFNMNMGFEKAFRDSFFQVASIITATGFATADYLQWHTFGWVLIFALMFIGASVGFQRGGGYPEVNSAMGVGGLKSVAEINIPGPLGWGSRMGHLGENPEIPGGITTPREKKTRGLGQGGLPPFPGDGFFGGGGLSLLGGFPGRGFLKNSGGELVVPPLGGGSPPRIKTGGGPPEEKIFCGPPPAAAGGEKKYCVGRAGEKMGGGGGGRNPPFFVVEDPPPFGGGKRKNFFSPQEEGCCW